MHAIRGDWRDIEVTPGGHRRLIGEGQNLVVASAAVILAMCVMPQAVPDNAGLLYWAVGDGNTVDSVAWDAAIAAGTLLPQLTDVALAREIFRKAILPADVVFVDATNNVSATPTNRLQISHTLIESEPGGSVILREFGLVGGAATAVAGSGLQFNRKVHKSYEKLPVSQLERTLILTF